MRAGLGPELTGLCFGEGICIFDVVCCGLVWGSHYHDLISSLGFMLYLFACVCDTHVQVPVDLWLQATLNCLLVCKCWESNSDVPEDLEALLTAKSFLQPLIYILKVYILVVVPRLRRKEGRPARGSAEARGGKGLLQSFQ